MAKHQTERRRIELRGSITNSISKWVVFCIPLGIVVYLTQKYLHATDNHGTTKWTRLYSSYGNKGFADAGKTIKNCFGCGVPFRHDELFCDGCTPQPEEAKTYFDKVKQNLK